MEFKIIKNYIDNDSISGYYHLKFEKKFIKTRQSVIANNYYFKSIFNETIIIKDKYNKFYDCFQKNYCYVIELEINKFYFNNLQKNSIYIINSIKCTGIKLI